MTQKKRELTNTQWCHHFLPREVSQRKRRGLQQVDKIKGLGTSPTFPLFLPPFRYNLKERTCLSVPTMTCIIRLEIGFFPVSGQSILLRHPSSGVCSYVHSSDPPLSSKAQSGSVLLSKQINPLTSISHATLSRPRCAIPWKGLLPPQETGKAL